MVDQGAHIEIAPVAGWYDCGKTETLLETNAHLLATSRGGVSDTAHIEDSTLDAVVRIEADATLVGSTLGPNVTVEEGARIIGSTLSDCIVGAGATVEDSQLSHSIIGAASRVQGFGGSLSVSDHSEVTGASDDG
jgi:glucose-1-phosphate thymidylyltransferase